MRSRWPCELTAAHPGMRSVVLDIGDPEAIQAAVDRLTTEVPALNVVIHNAGIMRAEDLTLGRLDDAEATGMTARVTRDAPPADNEQAPQ